MNIAGVIANLNDKNNFNKLIDFIIIKINNGIENYSVSEMQELGKIVDLINRFNKAKYQDNKVSLLNTKLIEAFEKIVKDDDLDSIKEVLATYPPIIIDELISKYSKSDVVEKSKNIKKLIEEMKTQFLYMKDINKVRSKKAISCKLDSDKLNSERVVAEDLYSKTTDTFNDLFESIRIKLFKEKEEIEKKIEDIKELWAPFYQSQFSEEDVKKWLEDIEDKGLFSLEGIDIDSVATEINEYMHLHPMKATEETIVQEETEVVPEAEGEEIDYEKEENRIQKVIETDIESVKKELKDVDDAEVVEDSTIIIKEVTIKQEEAIPIEEEDLDSTENQEHYNQSKLAAKLKNKHKKGLSI